VWHAEMCHRGKRGNQQRARRAYVAQLGSGGRKGAQAGAHREHSAHVCDAGCVKAQRLVESICILPSPKGASDTGKCVWYGDVAQVKEGEPAALVACVCGPARECGGRRRRRERTANILLMPVTLEVLKLSGWLKSYAFCRVKGGSTEMWQRGKHRGGISTRTACVCMAQLGSGGRRRMRERTANILLMSVTLEVSKLSGWLKAFAFCRVQRGHPTQGNACVARR
jgi:hypothetical protein